MQAVFAGTLLENIFLEITYAAERQCTADWELKGKNIYDRHNLIFVYDGQAELRCNEKTYLAKRGDLVYYHPGDYRIGKTFEANLMKCFTVDFFYTHPIYQEDKWSLTQVPLPFDSIENIEDSFLYTRLYNLFSQFTKTYFLNDYNRVIRAKSIFMEILSLLISWKCNPDFNYDHVRKVEKLIDFMSKHYFEKITLQSLAELSEISPTYLENIFKKITGKTPITYLIELRLQEAKNFMQDGHAVSAAAAKVGFNDVFYFSKCFKKYEGIAPVHFLKHKSMF